MPASDEGQAVLQNYFDAVTHFAECGPHLLSRQSVLERSGLFSPHPTVEQLGGYVLDDADTSDHHILVTSPPLIGSVLFLSHDGDTRIVFDSAETFLAAVREAHERGIDVTDLHPDLSPLAKDQVALSSFVRQVLETRALNDVVVTVIPSMDLTDLDLLQTLAQDEDFFLGEAVAIEIEKRPSPALLPIAELCAAQRHPQTAETGERAVRRIRRLG
jgi:hypothetical protein